MLACLQSIMYTKTRKVAYLNVQLHNYSFILARIVYTLYSIGFNFV